MNIISKTAPTGLGTPKPRIERDIKGIWHVRGYAEAKTVLMSDAKQAGFKAELVDKMPPTMTKPVLFQDGKEHREQRSQTSRFFTPRVVQDKYLPLIEKYADTILDDFTRRGHADLNHMTARLAMGVVAEVVGLTNSSRDAMARRIDTILHADLDWDLTPARIGRFIALQWRMFGFWFLDVRPAIRARQASPQNDLISHLLTKGYGGKEILAECITYGTAGMVTTQEFIVVAAWHFLEHPELRQRYLAAEQEERYRILYEILRIEPVVGHLFRRAVSDLEISMDDQVQTIPAGALIDLDIYAINVDARITGEAPLSLDPDREIPRGISGAVLGFGAGPHRCAGEFIAIAESDIFLHKLLSLEGLELAEGPQLRKNETIKGYELRHFIIRLTPER